MSVYFKNMYTQTHTQTQMRGVNNVTVFFIINLNFLIPQKQPIVGHRIVLDRSSYATR